MFGRLLQGRGPNQPQSDDTEKIFHLTTLQISIFDHLRDDLNKNSIYSLSSRSPQTKNIDGDFAFCVPDR